MLENFILVTSWVALGIGSETILPAMQFIGIHIGEDSNIISIFPAVFGRIHREHIRSWEVVSSVISSVVNTIVILKPIHIIGQVTKSIWFEYQMQ